MSRREEPGRPHEAAYTLLADTEFARKIKDACAILRDCTLCPRGCRVDRLSGKKGYCRTGDKPFVSSWGPHFGEERPLTGTRGSGIVFFGNCNLGCIFCQNYSISQHGEGVEISHEKLADIMISLQRTGCHNINLVTPTHQAPAVVRAVEIAAGEGLRIPLVYNCGGYESIETLKILEGVVDIYMPDFKYANNDFAKKYSDAGDYGDRAKSAIREMHRQVGDLVLDEKGIARRGLLVRHLVLPADIAGTGEVVRFIAEEISADTYINIMDQYHPCFGAFGSPSLDRRISEKEYSDALEYALRAGLKRIDGVNI
jgi:putative pyruvate formate lyase activating enzyme